MERAGCPARASPAAQHSLNSQGLASAFAISLPLGGGQEFGGGWEGPRATAKSLQLRSSSAKHPPCEMSRSMGLASPFWAPFPGSRFQALGQVRMAWWGSETRHLQGAHGGFVSDASAPAGALRPAARAGAGSVGRDLCGGSMCMGQRHLYTPVGRGRAGVMGALGALPKPGATSCSTLPMCPIPRPLGRELRCLGMAPRAGAGRAELGTCLEALWACSVCHCSVGAGPFSSRRFACEGVESLSGEGGGTWV